MLLRPTSLARNLDMPLKAVPSMQPDPLMYLRGCGCADYKRDRRIVWDCRRNVAKSSFGSEKIEKVAIESSNHPSLPGPQKYAK